MSDDPYAMVMPDRIFFNLNEDSIEYEEVYIAEDVEKAKTVAEKTKSLADSYVKELEKEDGDRISIDAQVNVEDRYVTVNILIHPGKPKGAENLGVAAIAGEVMGILAMTDPDMWNTVVSATENTAKDVAAHKAALESSDSS